MTAILYATTKDPGNIHSKHYQLVKYKTKHQGLKTIYIRVQLIDTNVIAALAAARPVYDEIVLNTIEV